MTFKKRSVNEIADLICGNREADETSYFPYRSSSKLTEFGVEEQRNSR